MPDYVFVSVGDGCIIGGIYKGFYDLMNLGLIEKAPKLIGVQAEGSNPFVRAFRDNRSRKLVDMTPETVADSISVGIPRASHQGLNAVYATEGEFIDVTDAEILEALKTLPRYAGVFGEPAGVTSLAGFIRMKKEGRVPENASCAIVITGNGLKDISTAISCVKQAPVIEPTLNAVKAALKI
jgi:threonine synthase